VVIFLGQIDSWEEILWDQEHVIILSNRTLDRQLIQSWESTWTGIPWGPGLQNDGNPVIVTTYASTSKPINYTSSLNDMTNLLNSANRTDLSLQYESVYSTCNRSIPPPNIDIYCYYGSQINTGVYYEWSENVFVPYETMMDGNGDGNQDIYDNQFCETWKDKMNQDYIFESKEFPGVHHMEMYNNEDVMNSVLSVLQKYAN